RWSSQCACPRHVYPLDVQLGLLDGFSFVFRETRCGADKQRAAVVTAERARVDTQASRRTQFIGDLAVRRDPADPTVDGISHPDVAFGVKGTAVWCEGGGNDGLDRLV